MQQHNHGLILVRPKPNSQRFGVFTSIEKKEIMPGADWTGYLSTCDKQRNKIFDAWDCVSESSAGQDCETQFNYLLTNGLLSADQREFLENNDYIKDGKVEFSVRFIAKLSGTIIGTGNYGDIVANTIKARGLVPRARWEFTDEMTAAEYYQDVPQDLLDLGLEFKKLFPMDWEWVERPNFPNALKYSPIQIFVDAWHLDANGRYRFEDGFNHAVCLVRATGNEIADSYDPTLKSLDDGNMEFFGIKYFINLNNKPMVNFKQNSLYLLIEGPEQKLGMFLDGALIIYSDKVDAILNSASRSKEYQIPVPLNLKDWDSVPHKNGKGEIIN